MNNTELRRRHLLAAIADHGSIEALAAKTGTNPKYLSQIKNGTRGMGHRFREKMEDQLGLSAGAWDQPLPLVGNKGEDIGNFSRGPTLDRSVPLISIVVAGELCQAENPYPPGGAERWVETYIQVKEGMYALRVEGDSMVSTSGGPSFTEGMIVIVDPTRRAENGSLVIARDGDGRATFKKLSIDGDQIHLVPLNTQYKAIPIQKELHICGVVIAAQIDLR